MAKLFRPSVATLTFLLFFYSTTLLTSYFYPPDWADRILANVFDVSCHATADNLRFCAEQAN